MVSALTDIDYAILMTKITALESRVSKLEECCVILPTSAAERREEFRKRTASIECPSDITTVIHYDDVLRSI